MLQAAHPKKIFIMAGTNDLVHISIEEYKQLYLSLLTAIKDSIPDAQIFIESVLPTNHEMENYAPNNKVQKANRVAKELASKMGLKYINLYDLYVDKHNELPQKITKDGVHLYPQYYDRWAKAIKPLIYE